MLGFCSWLCTLYTPIVGYLFHVLTMVYTDSYTSNMDWNMCLICQEMSKEPLKCLLKAEATRDKTETYGSFLKNVHTFRAMDMLQVVLDFGEDMTVDDLVQNRGAWHKSCYVKFSKEKLERAIKERSRHIDLQSTAVLRRNILDAS